MHAARSRDFKPAVAQGLVRSIRLTGDGKAARLRLGVVAGLDEAGLDTLSQRNEARHVGFNQKSSAIVADARSAGTEVPQKITPKNQGTEGFRMHRAPSHRSHIPIVPIRYTNDPTGSRSFHYFASFLSLRLRGLA